MKIKLFLTSDYEVWGDGRGSVPNSVIEPSDRMMSICRSFGAKLTFFMDVCEYWAMSNVSNESEFSYYVDWADEMATQLRNFIKEGHDVQLHFHPQWLNAHLNPRGEWVLDERLWRLSMIEEHGQNIDELFMKGKKTLEDLFGETKPDYRVYAFRAGAWCIQPEEKIILALKKHNIRIDSTAAYGMFFDDGKTFYDFRRVPDKVVWNIGKGLNDQIEDNRLFEMPIATSNLSLTAWLLSKLPKLFYRDQIFPEALERGKTKKKSLSLRYKKMIRSASSNRTAMLNFSDGATLSEMKIITTDWIERHSNDQIDSLPIVAISHPKTFGRANNLEAYLKWITDRYNVEFCTMSEHAKTLDH